MNTFEHAPTSLPSTLRTPEAIERPSAARLSLHEVLTKVSQKPPTKYLAGPAWQVALPAVAEAAFSAVPTDLRMAGTFVSHLCAFLQHHPEWDGTTAPDWDVLLTEETIDRYIALRAAAAASNSLRSAHQVTLRRVLRCRAGGPPLKTRSSRSRPTTAAAATASDPGTLAALQAKADRPDVGGRRARAWELLTLGAQIPGDRARQITAAQARSGLVGHVVSPLPPALLAELRELATGLDDADLLASGPVEPRICPQLDSGTAEDAPGPWDFMDGHRVRRLVLGGLLGTESPFSTVAACYSHGSPLDHGRLLNGFANALELGLLPRDALTEGAFWPKGAPPAALARMSTLLGAQQMGALHQQRPSSTEEPPMAPPVPVTAAPTSTAKRTRVHKNSRAARLRAANASIAARQDAADALDPNVPLQIPEGVRQEVAEHIVGYRHANVPPEVFAPVQGLFVRMMLAANPPTLRRQKALAVHFCRFVAWAGQTLTDTPSELRAHALWDSQVLIAYEKSLAHAGVPRHSVETARSEIRWILSRARHGGPARPQGPRSPQAPYGPPEIAAFDRLARNQPNDLKKMALAALVSLGAGAGLDGADFRHLTRRHVRRVTYGERSCFLIDVVNPAAPRQVILLEHYEPLLEYALGLHRRTMATDDLLLGRSRQVRSVNAVSYVVANSVTADDVAVDLDVTRLRKNWLITLMQAPVPLHVVLATAGLRSARALTDLMPWVPPPTEDELRACLHSSATALGVIRPQ